MSDSAKELKQEKYLIEGRKGFQFQQPTGIEKALIKAGEIFSTNVPISNQLTLDISEYRMLCSGY